MTDVRTDVREGFPATDQSRQARDTTQKRAGGTSGPSSSMSTRDDTSAPKSSETSFADELASLKETVAGQVTSMSSGAATTIRDASQSVANAASGALDAGASAASYAGEQAKSLANDLESFARRNPLGAMGGALAVGVLIGMLGRGRH